MKDICLERGGYFFTMANSLAKVFTIEDFNPEKCR